MSNCERTVAEKEVKVQEYKGNYEHAQKFYEETKTLYDSVKSQLDAISFNSNPDNLSFNVAKDGDKIYLRWQNKVYDSKDYVVGESKEISLGDRKSISWQKILNLPKDSEKSLLFLEQFKNLSNGNFVFVTLNQYDKSSYAGGLFKPYFYDWSKKRLTDLSLLIPKIAGYPVPLIGETSSGGRFILIDNLGCYACGGHRPQSVLVDLSNFKVKTLGKTSYFKWVGDEGEYEYKEFIPKTNCDYDAECFESPDDLPLKQGSF